MSTVDSRIEAYLVQHGLAGDAQRVVALTGCDLRGARLDGIDPLDCDFKDAVVTPEQAERHGLASRGVVIVR